MIPEVTYEPLNILSPGATIRALRIDGWRASVLIVTDRGTVVARGVTDCCAKLELVDTGGDPADVIGGRIIRAEVAYTDGPGECDEVDTWSFLRILTDKADLCLRWDGSHNGYYCAFVEYESAEDKPWWKDLPELG